MKILNIILIGLIVLSSCKKDDTEPNDPNNQTPTAQTKNLSVYMGDPAMINYFGGNAPTVKITENGTSNEVTLLVNTCSANNGSSFTITYGKSYSVVFGVYIDSTWAPYAGQSGTMTVDSGGLISGTIGDLLVTKATDFGGCGTTISGDILLFY